MTSRAIALTLLVTFAALSDTANAQRNPEARRAFRMARLAAEATPSIIDSATMRAFLSVTEPAVPIAETPTARNQALRGLDIIGTGTSSFSIQLHSGMLGNGAPLYVIDGAPAMELPQGIDWFKPADITRVEVLKTPAELSRYGARGANGVIVITTKNANIQK